MRRDGQAARPLTTELVLLCTSPTTGRLGFPSGFHRAFAGAELTELALAGAIMLDDRRITGVQPIRLSDPALAEALDLLSRAGRRSALKLEAAVRHISARDPLAFRGPYIAQGLIRKETHRALGFIPYLKFFATDPGLALGIATRVRRSLTAAGGDLGYGQPAEVQHDCQLAALMATVRLDRLQWPGPEGREERRSADRLAQTLPIARAVRRVISRDD
jgi:hypothetical protein